MRRSWNWLLSIGFAVALAAALSYLPVFAQFPVTRDFPWVNLLLFALALCLLGVGMYRAFAQPERYRGKVVGTIFSVVSLGLCALFCYGTLVEARLIPPGTTAVRVGQRAPEFALSDVNGKAVTLAQLLAGKRAVLLIFYRGYW